MVGGGDVDGSLWRVGRLEGGQTIDGCNVCHR